ncbi:MAG TPA: hypothetical protein VF064_02040 [Pyrinomonadaceae bacterium]
MFAGTIKTPNEVGGAEPFLLSRCQGLTAARRCPSCGEELSDRFGFCPMDGTPLDASRIVEGRDDFRLTVVEHRALPVRLLAALFEAAHAGLRAEAQSERLSGPNARAAAEAVGRMAERHEEVCFAMLEDAGLLRRLAGELSAFARDSRLTWPEFRRDPAGFIRRAFDALDTLGLIPFSRRHQTHRF